MRSPRFGGSHRRTHTLACLAAVMAALAAIPCRAQTTGAVPAAGPDSTGALRPDSAGADSAGTDSTAVAPGDTLSRPGRDGTRPPARPAPPPAPVDSVLGAACEESAGGPSDLLMVKFQPSATASEREAVAREVGGTLAGTSEHAAPGSWYLRVPGSAGDRSVADRLILLSPVLEVGTTRCPA